MSTAVNYDSYRLSVTSHCIHGNIETYYVIIDWDFDAHHRYTAHAEISISPDGSVYHVLDLRFDTPRIPMYAVYHFCKGIIDQGEEMLIEAVKNYCSQLYPTE